MTVNKQLMWIFKQYIPSKPGKYGIKTSTMCNSVCFYPCKMLVDTSKDAGLAQETN